MYYLLIKSLHLVAMVAWFAGLFYLIRLFVYHTEAASKPESEREVLIKQYQLMESRLYNIICQPAMILTWLFGLIMIFMNGYEWFTDNIWLHQKILLVILLTAYQLNSKKIMNHLLKQKSRMSSFQLRLYNEIPTLLLLSIILLAVYKNLLNFVYALGGIIAFALLLFAFAKIYKSLRSNQ